MSGYIGTQPIPRASRILTQGALSTDTQTINVPGGYNPGNIFVYLDGARLRSSDFDDSSGTTIDLLEVFPTGTEYIVEEIRSFEIPNHYTKTEIQDASFDFNNMPTVGGDPIVESGSNTDGEWTRWADGRQGSWSRHEFIGVSDGSIVQADIPHPMPFTVAPEVVAEAKSNDDNSVRALGGTETGGNSATGVRVRAGNFRSTLGTTAIDIDITVFTSSFGLWK